MLVFCLLAAIATFLEQLPDFLLRGLFIFFRHDQDYYQIRLGIASVAGPNKFTMDVSPYFFAILVPLFAYYREWLSLQADHWSSRFHHPLQMVVITTTFILALGQLNLLLIVSHSVLQIADRNWDEDKGVQMVLYGVALFFRIVVILLTASLGLLLKTSL